MQIYHSSFLSAFSGDILYHAIDCSAILYSFQPSISYILASWQLLEYCGRGKSLIDVGLAQARTPLNTTSHYFEMEIVDPGRSGYITIGLTKKVWERCCHFFISLTFLCSDILNVIVYLVIFQLPVFGVFFLSQKYPKNRHPGWNRGSIAYHADDGRVFAGSTVGSLFGPRCHKGDVMGCGIIFPRDYVCNYDR